MSYKWPDKDPQEQLDYSIDWSRFLGTTSSGSAIGLSSAEWFVDMDTESTLTEAISKTQTYIKVADISKFSDLTVGSRLRIGKELLRYSGETLASGGLDGSGTITGLFRGVDGTTQSSHSSGSVVSGDRTKLTDATEVNNIQAVSFSNTATVTTIILSLGSTEVGRYKFTCRIATNTSPANYYERTVFLRIKDK